MNRAARRSLDTWRRHLAVALGLAGCIALTATAAAQSVRENIWGTDGKVDAVAYANNLVYLGGSFTRVGPPTGGFAGVNISSGQTLQPYFQVNGTVYAMVRDGSGGWFIGGDFVAVRGQPRNRLAHLDANGNLLPWNPNGTGLGTATVRALALYGSTLYVGGDFANLGGQARYGLGAVDATTGAVTSWNPQNLATIFVDCLTISGSTLYVGGSFSGFPGQSRPNVASFDLTTGNLTSWNPGTDGIVHCLIAGPLAGMITIGGDFQHAGGLPHSRLAMIDQSTGAVSSWNPSADAPVLALAFDLSVLYVGGQFTHIGVSLVPRNRIAALDYNTGAATSWDPNANSDVRSFVVRSAGGIIPKTVLYVGGQFSSIGGAERHFLAEIDGTGSAMAWGPYCSGIYSFGVTCMAPSDDGTAIYAGGNMDLVGSVPRNNAAALDATTGEPTDWNANVTGGLGPSFYGDVVQALAIYGNTVFIGGNFTYVQGQAHDCLAAVDALTGAPIAWNLDTSPQVTCFKLNGATLYAGGSFSSVAGQTRGSAVSINATNGVINAWNPNFNNKVRALTVRTLSTYPFTPTVYAGGDFTYVGTTARGFLAAVDGNTGALSSWNPGLTQSVHCLLYLSCGFNCAGTIWAGGPFSTGAGGFQHYAAAWDAGTAALKSWNPSPNGAVESMYYYNGSIYVGGAFTNIGGQARSYTAALDTGVGTATSWDPQTSNATYAFAANGDNIFLGGSFATVLDAEHTCFGATSDGAVTAVETSDAPPVASVLRASPNPFSGTATLRFSLAKSEIADVDVFDVSGRLVRRLSHGTLAAGPHAIDWDGRNDAGRAVGSGIYLLRLETPSERLASKVLRVN